MHVLEWPVTPFDMKIDNEGYESLRTVVRDIFVMWDTANFRHQAVAKHRVKNTSQFSHA